MGISKTAAEHNQDIKTLVEFLRKDNPNLPVWLVGTSNGSLTVTGASIALSDTQVAGVVLALYPAHLPHNVHPYRGDKPFVQIVAQVRMPWPQDYFKRNL